MVPHDRQCDSVAERGGAIVALEKIMALVAHDSPVYQIAAEEHAWLKSEQPPTNEGTWDVLINKDGEPYAVDNGTVRLRVEASWHTVDTTGNAGPSPVTVARDSGELWVPHDRQCDSLSPDKRQSCTVEQGHVGAHVAIDPMFGSVLDAWPNPQRMTGGREE